MATQNKPGFLKRFIIALAVIVVLGLAGTMLFYYLRYYGPNVTDKEEYLYVHTGSTYTDVYNTIKEKGIVKDTAYFNWTAYNMKYVGRVKPGKYRLKPGMSNHALIRMLQLGQQEQVDFTFHGFRTKEQFAAFAGKKLESDSLKFLRYLDSGAFVKQFGFNTDNAYVMIMPDSYKMYWNTSPEKFYKRMYTHYQAFWTAARKQKASAINLSPIQVSILASIVDAEALHDEEMPRIAGLYLNRLKRHILLQSDPTVIFAVHDFTIRRVLNRHLQVVSPYNTYKVQGLPPGPVMMPSVNAIKAVLDYERNDYLFMCAKEDFSGNHNFAVTQAEHDKNAARYRAALDARNIKK